MALIRSSMKTSFVRKNFLAIALGAVILIFLSLRFKKFLGWAVLSFTASYIKFFRIKNVPQLPIIFEPVLFTATVLTRGYGLNYSIFFLLGPNMLAEIITGGLQFNMFISSFKFVLYQVINLLLIQVPVIWVGILLAFLDVVVDYFMNTFIWGLPPYILIYNITHFICHVVYFSIFGELIVGVLKSLS